MLKKMNKIINTLNSSKYFTGIMMIMLNIGSKYITVKLSKSQEAYVKNYIIREILIFSIARQESSPIVALFSWSSASMRSNCS